MTNNAILLLIGGLGFFFFGMKTMSEGLAKIAGEKLKNFLHSVTKLPIIGVLVGAFVTCLIQSSSATTVMVVGFVNAGLLVLKQAIPVIMGANIGTTVTAWLVSSMSVFKITNMALPSVGISFAIMTFATHISYRKGFQHTFCHNLNCSRCAQVNWCDNSSTTGCSSAAETAGPCRYHCHLHRVI